MTLKCDTCGTTALKLVDDNGVVDPADGDRLEIYECEFGHTQSLLLKA
jgi:hypothetical protein